MKKYKEIFGIVKERFSPKIDLRLTYEKIKTDQCNDDLKIKQISQSGKNDMVL